jgi:phosphoribosylformimino-5-aminoimidazole carboxamide ribotide isomerase
MTRFRPCIDLHQGRVKQIVGSTLRDAGEGPRENFVSEHGAAYYAEMYRRDGLTGAHVIMLGSGNDEAARAALGAWPQGLQLGGGIRSDNAAQWLTDGASHVIVTSFIFDEQGRFREDRLSDLVKETGADRLVLDLSCKRTEHGWTVAMNRWQTLTDLDVTHAVLDQLAVNCDEFLIHAVDVEGKCEGIDTDLVMHLAAWGKKPMTYAGGARNLDDLRLVDQISQGRIDVTIGSALDVFGGNGVRYADCVAYNLRSV